MAANLGELFIELGVFADTQELQKFENKLNNVVKKTKEATQENKKLDTSVKDFIKGIGAVGAAVAGAVVALSKLTESLVKSNQEFLNLTRTSDISLSTFQKWNNVGKMLGVNNAAAQIENLNQKLFELKLTGQGAEGFMLAGINPLGQDAQGVMEQLRNRIQGLDDTSASYLLRQMGLDPSMLHLLRMTREEFEELGATVSKYQLTDEQTKQIQAMNIQLQIAQTKLNYLKDRAILAIMPYFVEFMKSLARVSEMLARVGKSVGDFVVKWRGLVGGIVLGLARIKPVATFFAGMSKSIGSLIVKLPIFGRFLGAIGGVAARALLPFTALYLILDDLAVFFRGGKSVIGEIKDWSQEKFSEISGAFSKIFGGDALGGLGELGSSLLGILNDIASTIEKIFNFLIGGKNFNPYELGVKLGENIGKWLMENKERVNKALTGRGESIREDGTLLNGIPVKNIIHGNTTTNQEDNRQISMTNHIYTSQAAQTVQDELAYAQQYAYSYA